jgi:alpha-tubulin suppressor-like RCC1 family protein
MKKKYFLFLFLLSTILHAQCWEKIASGYYHSAAIKTDGTLWTWGNNQDGELGIGTDYNIDGFESNRNIPVQVGFESNWQSVSLGWYHTAAIKNDGTLWCWGGNEFGQVGDGTLIERNLPVQIGTDNNWRSVASGQTYTLAIKTDGTLWAWGQNQVGQLGNGTTSINETKPQQIGTDTNWQSLTTGRAFSLAIKTNGTLWAWGVNNSGQLGDGTKVNKNVPTQVGTMSDWQSVSAGDSHTLGLSQDGKLLAWGLNSYGELGNGTNNDSNVPILIGTATNWKKIEAGSYYSYAIKTTGQLYKFGNGLKSPTSFDSSTDWQEIKTDSFHTLALKTGNSLSASGYNTFGQLGNNTNADSTNFIQVRCTTLGVESNIGSDFSIYPIPVKSILNFHLGNNNYQINQITIVDLQGRIIYKTNDNLKQLNLSNFESGLYYIKIITNNQTFNSKFIKE